MRILQTFLLTLSIFNLGHSQIPEKYESLEYVFKDNHNLKKEDLPDSLLSSINLVLNDSRLVYRKHFYPVKYDSRDTLEFLFEIDSSKLNIISKNDTIANYHIESYFPDQMDLFKGDFDLFVEKNGVSKNLGYLSIYYLTEDIAILKEWIYVQRKFPLFNRTRTELKSVFLLELKW